MNTRARTSMLHTTKAPNIFQRNPIHYHYIYPFTPLTAPLGHYTNKIPPTFNYIPISILVQVELYIPRKCSATNRIIKAKDHASVQIAVANVDEEGRAIPDSNTLYALSGFVRSRGEADDQINRLAQQDGLLNNVWSYSR